MIVDEHIWLYFNYVSLAVHTVRIHRTSHVIHENINQTHQIISLLLTDDYGNKNRYECTRRQFSLNVIIIIDGVWCVCVCDVRACVRCAVRIVLFSIQ